MGGTHVIRRQVLDVELAGSESDGLALQQRLPDLSRDVLGPGLERVLDALVPDDEHWIVDRLEIDAGTFEPQAFERGFADAVAQSLQRYLRDHAPAERTSIALAQPGSMQSGDGAAAVEAASTVQRRSPAQSIEAALIHFLRTGLLPWWFQLPRERTLEAAVLDVWQAHGAGESDATWAPPSLIEVLREASARVRLVRQFSQDFLFALLDALSHKGASTVRAVLTAANEDASPAPSPDGFIEHVWERAFAFAVRTTAPTAEVLIGEALQAATRAGHAPPASRIERLIRQWPSMANVVTPAEAPLEASAPPQTRRADRIASLDLDEGVYVTCAGLVLLHPFLPRLFEGTGIAREGRLLQPDRALALLHFLSTGQRVTPEYDLPLPKLLCGLPLDYSADAHVMPTAGEEDEAGALLAAVVGHWDALGNTSIDGLRGTFLVRPGCLARRGDASVLQVEPQSYDVLLDRLPWGIGTVQLPWMNGILWVEWRF